ncbi:YdjY domain-containing protein [Paludisphaera borealis]|uniref:Uncharacterized protein n=1 Tax=Paludisphaera borealis TaxID=1387353 RepID=A0A1U7CX57_9BACT|nr:YdjY domain-containing protein [Paludisphaera borealis]APW63463.1 hypothetical protein BSF38_05030 [Paludisphaera borealis]
MNVLILPVTLLALLPQQPADDGRSPTPAAAAAVEPSPDWKPAGRSLWFDAQSKPKRLIVRARVVLREGALEHFLCLKGTKEHEAIVATDADPRQIHAGLLLTGAEPGHPVRFKPKFEPPAGSTIDITVRWKNGGKIQEVDARHWVKDEKTKKELDVDWVFAGSLLYEDPVSKKMIYAAEEGDLITVANFGSSILDLPIASSADDSSRVFIANTAQLPPLGTEVQLILSPRPPKPKVEKTP